MLLAQLKKEKPTLRKVTEIRVSAADGTVSYQSVDGDNVRPGKPSEQAALIESAYDAVAAEIVQGHLFLGSQDAMGDAATLTDNKITHVLHVAFCERPQTTIDLDVEFHSIPLYDTDEQSLLETLVKCCNYIDGEDRRVLVTCNAGVSRSASIVIGYLMQRKGMSFEEAHRLVAEKRPSIRPNAGFRRQLQEMDGL